MFRCHVRKYSATPVHGKLLTVKDLEVNPWFPRKSIGISGKILCFPTRFEHKKGLCIQKRFCVSINNNFLCPGKVVWLQERYCVSRNDILCPGKVLCVQEWYSVPWKGNVCPGMIFCAQERYCVSRKDILCPGKVMCVQEWYSVSRKGIVCPGMKFYAQERYCVFRAENFRMRYP